MTDTPVPEELAALSGSPEPCSVEVYRRNAPGDVRIWYWVSEKEPTDDEPYPDPVNIIGWDQTLYVVIYVHLPDAVRRHFCGTLCVDLDIDTCGPSPDKQFPEKEIELDPCGNGWYRIVFTLEPGTFRPHPDFPARCGRVYRVCVTIGSHDLCDPPGPGLIWGHCDSFELAVHPPVPNP